MRVPNTALITMIYLALPVVGSRISLSCLLFMKPCVSPEICKSELLRNICSSEDSSCETLSSERCNATFQAILGHSPKHSPEQVCTDDDPCSALQLLSSLCQSYSAGSSREILKEELSVANRLMSRKPRESGPNSSCLQVMTRCVGDEVCNRQLVPFVQSCSEPQCEDSRCRLATRSFFSGLPQNVAEMLTFCQCEEADQDCRDVQNILQSSSCSVDQTPWNCLEMLESCSADRLCRQTFEGFLSKCFGPEEASFTGYSTRELLHLIDVDFFLSGDKECRKAFVATMGSPLQSPCTCHGLHHENSYSCNMLKQAVQNRTQFRLRNYGTWREVHSTQPHGYKHKQSRVQFSDQLWYFLAYTFVVLLILIVVTVVLHKLRAMHNLSKKKRFPSFSEDSTKSVDL